MTKTGQNLGYRVTAYINPKIKRVKNRLRYLTQDEETRLLNALDPNHEDCRSNHYLRKNTQHADKVQADYDLTILLLDTGARLNEIQKLEWKSVDLENRVIHLWRPKVENESVLHMTHRVFDVLNRRKQTATAKYVFTDTKGSYRKSIQGLRKTMDKVGLQNITLHGLRHTCASKLVQNGLSIYEVKELLDLAIYA